MTTSHEAGSGLFDTSATQIKEYLLLRDKEQPLSFAGVRLARAVRGINQLMVMADEIEAAVYKTRGGKFITSLVRTPKLAAVAELFGSAEDAAGPAAGYNKAAVHESLADAMAWFRPGRLTDDIRKQLGLDQPLRIE
jgi:hypothetical protein